jgi:hypothetical protein
LLYLYERSYKRKETLHIFVERNGRTKVDWRERGKKTSILTQATGLRHIIDISIHFLCFDQTAGHRERIPFYNTRISFSKDM